MSQIEVPDWVLEIAAKAYFEDMCSLDRWNDPMDEKEREDWRDGARKIITAALGAWVVPAQFQARARFMEYHWCEWEKFKDEPTRDSWFDAISRTDGWKAEMRTLYTLRQEKPE